MNSPSDIPQIESPATCLWEALSLGSEFRLESARETARIIRELGAAVEVEASGVATRVNVTREDVESQLLPLAIAFQNWQRTAQRRIFVGVAGGAGSGKTVLAALLCRVLRVLEGREIAVPVSMDGYHFPTDFLEAQRGIENGREVGLREIKGRPPTFDVEAFAADLRRLRSPLGDEREIRLPVYDRRRHDPVPEAMAVQPHHRIVIVEGLHLVRPEPGWNEVRAGLDFCLLLELPLATCRRRVVFRKVAGGRTPDDALAHFERVDRPTIEELQDPAWRSRADLVLQFVDTAGVRDAAPVTVLAGCERREAIAGQNEFRAIPPGTIHLLAVGLNPALQKTLVCDRWERGQVNRARAILTSVGGKGQQFSRAASRLIPGMVSLAQFLGGENGVRLSQMIAAAGVSQINVPVAGETRACITVIDSACGEATELVEPSPPIAPSEVAQLLARIREALARGDISGLALCGTYPPGVDADFYATLARQKGNALLLLDSYKGIETTLATGEVDILKVNADELRSLAGGRPGAAEAGAAPLPEVALSVFEAHRLRWLAVTAGPRTAWLFENPRADEPAGGLRTWRFFEFRLPVVEGVINPIGAGDTVGAVFLAQLAAGVPAPAAFATGLAAGSASCRQLGGADFTLEDLRDILAKIQVSGVTQWWAERWADWPRACRRNPRAEEPLERECGGG